jgi:hypothetical protein
VVGKVVFFHVSFPWVVISMPIIVEDSWSALTDWFLGPGKLKMGPQLSDLRPPK